MKKILYSVFALFIAAFTFTSCEDVPAPYSTPEEGGQGGQDLPEGIYVDESFSSSFGSFTEYTTKGTPWMIDFNTAKGSGYDNGSKTTTESERYLVSSEIDLTGSTEAYLQFEYIYRYANRAGAENKVLITDSYTGNPTTTAWEDITGTLVEGSDWVTFSTYARNLDSEYLGKKIVIAFYYACTNNSSTWEVRNVKVAEGKVEDTPDTPDVPEDGVLLDQDFSSTLGNFTSISASGTLSWYNDFSSAMVTGYQDFDGDGTKENQAGVTYFVGPEISLEGIENAYITINHAINYERGDINVNNSILISNDYNGDVNTATWEQLTYDTSGLGNSFTFRDINIDIPANYIGGNVVIAFRHTCDGSFSSTWEVKSIKVRVGTAADAGDGGGDTGTSGEGLATITKSGTTVTMVDPDVTTTGETVTYDLNEFTSESSTDATTVTMDDGTTIAFSQEDGRNSPIFHSGTRGVRMYAHNSMTITPIKKIARIVLQCDSYQGTDYICNPQMYTEINGNVWKTVNDWETNSGGTQLRIQTLTVTFAE